MRTFRFSAGENLTGSAALVFGVDGARYPNGTVFAYSFVAFTEDEPQTKVFQAAATVTVSGNQFAVSIAPNVTESIDPKSYGWELWDTTNGQRLAGGRLVLSIRRML